ncbi:uncharacterized protein LOC142164710 [Nicotiana tabacum]|uniref:Uncharacterized protein LOC142164710 n=1 Tax=Nicotiana tabacum TaxID=4097 RepID=A0AC58S2M3_TOBAC
MTPFENSTDNANNGDNTSIRTIPSSIVLDHNHPLYLHASDGPGSMSVGLILTGMENYSLWSRAMKVALLGKNKLCLVDGSTSKEDFGPNLGRHLKEKCYKIIGYPYDFKQKKKANAVMIDGAGQQGMIVSPTTSIYQPSSNVEPAQFFIKEQYNQLLQLMNKSSTAGTSANMAARQTRAPFPTSTSRSLHAFDLIHIDVWGPYKIATHNGMKYFLTLVDDFTRWTWVFLMRLKSDVIFLFKNFISMIKIQFGKQIKMFRSDNGSEFFNSACSDLFQMHGIVHQSSCPYTPQQNGVVERRYRHILETARAIIFQGHLPIRYWGHCIDAALYIINRIPSSVLGHKSPYELLLGKPPSLTHLKVVGCLCFTINLTSHDKFAPRVVRSVFLGYAAHQKGYRLLNLENKVFFISRDVVFYEDIFTFHTTEESSESLFMDKILVPRQDFDEELNAVSSATDIHIEGTNMPCSPTLTSVISDEQVFSHPVEYNSVDSPGDSLILPDGEEARKSTRVSKPAIWLKDYIRDDNKSSASCCKYPISEVIGYEAISSKYQSYLANFSVEMEPTSYSEAVKDKRWVEAMQAEIKALEDNMS